MKKTYYQQDLVTNLKNKDVKASFRKIGSELFKKDLSYKTEDVMSAEIPEFVQELIQIIKKFFYAIDIADPLLVLIPNYLVHGKKIGFVNKPNHPLYKLFNLSLSEPYTENDVLLQAFSVSIDEKVLKQFLTDYVFYSNPSALADKTSFYKYWFIFAAKQFIEEKTLKNSYSYKNYRINTHTTKNLSTINAQNLYYDFDSQYNFYIKQYERTFFSGSRNVEGIIPNYYAIENYLNTDESEQIKSVVSLGNRVPTTEETILNNNYYIDYANVVAGITDVTERATLPTIRNYILDSHYGNTKNLSLSSENFPYTGKISFSNYPVDSLIQTIQDKNLDTLVVNNAHYLFTNTQAISKINTNNFYLVEETITKKRSENGDYTDYDGNTYELKVTNNTITQSVQYTNQENLFNFVNESIANTNQSKVGFEVYTSQDFAFYLPENKKYLNLLKKPLAIFPYLTLNGQIQQICNNRLDYKNVLNYQFLDVYPLCFQVEKTFNDSTINTISIARNANNSEVSFNDTQISYDKPYNYKVYSLNLVNPINYKFDNLQYKLSTNSVDGQIILQGDCSVFKNLIIDEQLQVFDNPPVPIDVNILPYINTPNRMLFLLNTQSTKLLETPKIIFQNDIQYFEKVRKKQKLNSKKVLFETIEDIERIQVFRLQKPPKYYNDFRNALYRVINLNQQTSTSFVDTLQQNIKYYYIFRSIDVHNNVSNPTEVFQVEIKNNDGAIFPIVQVYEMNSEDDFQYDKSFKKYLSINPSVLFTQFQKLEDGSIQIGNESGLWEQRFKIRVTSKKSGKSFDLNLTFNKKIRNLIDSTNDLNSDLETEDEQDTILDILEPVQIRRTI